MNADDKIFYHHDYYTANIKLVQSEKAITINNILSIIQVLYLPIGKVFLKIVCGISKIPFKINSKNIYIKKPAL
jgi:hypothetical protein